MNVFLQVGQRGRMSKCSMLKKSFPAQRLHRVLQLHFPTVSIPIRTCGGQSRHTTHFWGAGSGTDSGGSSDAEEPCKLGPRRSCRGSCVAAGAGLLLREVALAAELLLRKSICCWCHPGSAAAPTPMSRFPTVLILRRGYRQMCNRLQNIMQTLLKSTLLQISKQFPV